MKLARGLAALLLAAALGGCTAAMDPADLSDAAIKARIETSLRGQVNLDLRFVTVDVDNRVVTLSGMVGSFRDRDTIHNVARRTRGVDTVIVNLIVPE